MLTNLSFGTSISWKAHDRCLLVLKRTETGVEAVLKNLARGDGVSRIVLDRRFRKNLRFGMAADNAVCRFPILDLRTGPDGFATILKGRVQGLRLIRKSGPASAPVRRQE